MSTNKPLTAFVLGGTGNAGKGIVKALLANPNFEKVTLIGRHRLEIPSLTKNPNYAKIDQQIIDFENPSTYDENTGIFQGYDVGFCALGSRTYVGLTDEEFYRVNHDYAVETAKIARIGGCKHFHYVSGRGASKTSRYHWVRTKAEIEEKLSQMGFERLSIYRSAGIIRDTTDVMTNWERFATYAFKILDPFRFVTIESLTLGKVIVSRTFQTIGSKSEILENSEILRLGKEC